MAPSTPQPVDDSHQRLIDQLNPLLWPEARRLRLKGWKSSQRRNKLLKQVLSESQRREASALASQNNSGTTTPFPPTEAATDGAVTPTVPLANTRPPNIAQAAQSLSTLVLERNLQRSTMPLGPAVTYTNIESAPSLHPAHNKHYCDITGLPSRYTDPKTGLRYHDKEVFGVVRTLPQGVVESYLAARGAHVVLK
jgi:INO80 complex subunit C